jgi:6-phosphogluconate dehydrogenase
MNKEIVFVGLGRMGMAMGKHLVEEGYKVHGFDVSEDIRVTAKGAGLLTYNSIEDTIGGMEGQKVVWLMVPSKFVDSVLEEVYPQLLEGDIIIDGGNTFFKDTLSRAEFAKSRGINYVDCGTSGGVTGARNGASLMVGGDQEIVRGIEHLFKTLATENGYAHIGATGAGHFVKMVHNGIEYGMMGAIAEGMSFIEDNEEALQLNAKNTLKPYVNGSIITSNLMSWMADAYSAEGYMDSIAGEVPKGETEAEMEYLIEHKKTPVLEAALNQRKSTRENPSRIGTLISALRNTFGGHLVNKK